MPPGTMSRQKSDQKTMKEIIHSGHFMVSDIDDPEVQDCDDSPSLVAHESDNDQESLPLPEKGFDFEAACQETTKTYTSGSRSAHSISIDASLTKLFECMTLAYSGKLTSPRWKQFKGLKLRLKEKIRLNNMIWRAWHMQFVMKIKTDKLCQFATPLDGDSHMRAEAIVIEGIYGKRKSTNISAEYQKWRLFYKDRLTVKPNLENENMDFDFDTRWPTWPKDTFSPLTSTMDEDFIMDFTDTLFTSFNPSQPFDFPNPREIAARAGIADFIQPGLVQLQPTVDDFMDTIEPLSDLFSDFLNSKLPPLPEEHAYTGSSLQDIPPSSLESQSYYGKSSHYGRMTPNFLNTATNQQTLPNALSKRTYGFKKPILPAAPKPPPSQQQQQQQQQPYILQPTFANKGMVETLSQNNVNNVLIGDNVPLMTGQPQAASQQPFLCNTVPNQPQQNSSIESLLQSSLSAEVASLPQPSLEPIQAALQMVSPNRSAKREQRINQFFQQPTYVSKSFDETDLSHQQRLPQSPPSIQVPLQTIPQGHIVQDNISSASSKNEKQQMYFSVLSQVDQGPQLTGNFKVPGTLVPTTNGSYQPLQPATVQNFGKSSHVAVTYTDSQTFRRHSYTTGQHAQSSGDFMSSRRSRPIAPATSNANFAVPEVPVNRRTRSRSVSSPQMGSPKPFHQQQQQPAQAVSLTDISSPVQAVIAADVSKRPLIQQSSMGQTVLNSNNSSVLQQNALIAQLLSTGCTQQEIGQALLKVTSAPTTNVTSSVTIIRPILPNNAHTLVFSSLPMSTASGVSDLQRNLLVSNNNQLLCKQDSPPTCVLPNPDSPGSSTCSSSPAISVSFDSSPAQKTVRLKSDEEKIQYKEHRRVCHINAEQKRRCNIKNGFESLHNLLPTFGQTPNSKVSKAAMLQRGAEYIRTLRIERQQQMEEVEMLKKKVEELNQTINLFQNQLPASGAPVPCQRTNRMNEMFHDYVRQQTLQNPKFYIFSLIMESLVDSYSTNVSTANMEEMCKSIGVWLDQHCSLASLRPKVLNALRHLSTSTSILSDPTRVPQEAIQAVTKKENRQ